MSMSWVAYRETACLTRERPAIVIRKLRSAPPPPEDPPEVPGVIQRGRAERTVAIAPDARFSALPPDAARSPPKISTRPPWSSRWKAGIRKASYTRALPRRSRSAGRAGRGVPDELARALSRRLVPDRVLGIARHAPVAEGDPLALVHQARHPPNRVLERIGRIRLKAVLSYPDGQAARAFADARARRGLG